MKKLVSIYILFLSFQAVAQVSSVTGTANQVITSGSTGAVTLSLPQGIGTASSPQFSSLVLGGPVNSAISFYNRKNITGAVSSFSNLTSATILSDVTSGVSGYTSNLSTQAASFTLANLVHFNAVQGTVGAGSAIGAQYGYRVENSLIGANSNYAFWSGIPSGTNRWNIYMGGNAQNYLAGNTGFGIAIPTQPVDVNGNIRLSGGLFLGPAISSGSNFYNNKPITGASASYGSNLNAIIQSDVNVAYGSRSVLSTQAASFDVAALVHYNAGQGTFGAGSSVINQYGFLVEPTLIGATSLNIGFRSQIPASSGRWNLYMDGTAANYMAGNLGIGTTNPTEKLSVNGNIRAKEIRVEVSPWPDYVFHKTYSLQPLSEVERFIQANQHLPEIPSAFEVEKDGVSLGDMNAKLLKKIEELTLYLIEQQKQKQQQDLRIAALEKALLAGARK